MLNFIENKACQSAPSFKGNAAIIIDGNEFIEVPEGEVKEEPPVLTRAQRMGMARRGEWLGGK